MDYARDSCLADHGVGGCSGENAGVRLKPENRDLYYLYKKFGLHPVGKCGTIGELLFTLSLDDMIW